jgi:hypothetical protein
LEKINVAGEEEFSFQNSGSGADISISPTPNISKKWVEAKI